MQYFIKGLIGTGIGYICLGGLFSIHLPHVHLFAISPVIAMPTPLLDAYTIQTRMQTLPGWKTDGKQLTLTRKFKNFVDAIAFVNKLVEPAEAANHHPDLTISYNKVSITLTTHDSGGLTDLDFQLAHIISNLE